MYRDLPILHIESAHLQIMLVTEYHIVEITEIYSNQIEISSNQIFSNFFAKCYFHEIFAKKRVRVPTY